MNIDRSCFGEQRSAFAIAECLARAQQLDSGDKVAILSSNVFDLTQSERSLHELGARHGETGWRNACYSVV